MQETFKRQLPDIDPLETREWLDSLESLVDSGGRGRAQFVLYKLLKRARMLEVGIAPTVKTRYINTISPEQEPPFPGDENLERRIRRLIRWNAAVMVTRANRDYAGLGGHLSSYASAATLYETGFNHFFRGKGLDGGGDHVFFQGHAAPGIYARAYLEGRLTEDQLDHFRREVSGKGLSSYPHPRLMPGLWEYPTVSMGIGPINAIYQARFNRYLHARGIADTSGSRVWAFLGDGETDEPEALGALSLASREGLDNLIFVVNCNLQRLDGPVRGNGKIIQELESVFRGAGWDVLKVIWGREWDDLLARDVDGHLVERMGEILDGDFQRFPVESGAKNREEFFNDSRLASMVEHLSDDQIHRLRRGGHDYRKVYSAFRVATATRGAPTCILAHTVKGWMLGKGFEARNKTHQMKKLADEELRIFRDRLELPISDAELADAPYYHPGPKSDEVQYMLERRRVLGGNLPERRTSWRVSIDLPKADLYAQFLSGSGERQFSTTMGFVALLRQIMKSGDVGRRVVPIIPDEARTFGMESLFREFKIYSSTGQLYTPVDAGVLLSYVESRDGQLIEEGITEAGSLASFTAAGTSYASHGQPMIPFFILYSMFGFQRVGDMLWAFGDARGRGFVMGATAGRTTLNGEGLQHQDGHSTLIASCLPSCLSYDPAFVFEVATIIQEGLRRMWDEDQDVLYYITLYNENYAQEAMPDGVRDGILAGIYPFRPTPLAPGEARHRARLVGSGPILLGVLGAQQILAERYGVAADVYSATSWSELRRDALAVERWNRLHPGEAPRVPWVTSCLEQGEGPVVVASDFMKALPDGLARWIPGELTSLGTDGYGRSDTRPALRRHFEVDAEHVVVATLSALLRAGEVDEELVAGAIREFGIDPEAPDPQYA